MNKVFLVFLLLNSLCLYATKEQQSKRDKDIASQNKLEITFNNNRQKNGKKGSEKVVPFTNFQNKAILNFKHGVPKWRKVSEGLSIEGVCVNNKCEAFKKKVWIVKGFGTFFMHYTLSQAVCPICKTRVRDAKTCGFYKCIYYIKGRYKDKDGVEKEYNKTGLYKDTTTFKKYSIVDGLNKKTYDWVYLSIIAVELLWLP